MATDPQPYRWCFPLGWLFGCLGVGIWIAFWRHVGVYPGFVHSEVMSGGFVLLFTVGFLMTAIPRFTGTAPAGRTELSLAVVLGTLALATALTADRRWFHGAIWLQIIALCRFLICRAGRARLTPPPSFLFVGLGLLAALTASTCWVAIDWGIAVPPWLTILARPLFFYGFIEAILLGVGSQLLPMIFGVRQPAPIPFGRGGRVLLARTNPFLWYGVICCAAFVFQARGNQTAAGLLQAGIVTVILLRHWRLHRWWAIGGALPRLVQVGAGFLLLGSWVPVAFPRYAVHGVHLFFIGAVTVMIFGIATRVILAHGGHDLRLEKRSRALRAILVLFLIALAARLAAPLLPSGYYTHLAYAAMGWIVAAGWWGLTFLPKLRSKREDCLSCEAMPMPRRWQRAGRPRPGGAARKRAWRHRAAPW